MELNNSLVNLESNIPTSTNPKINLELIKPPPSEFYMKRTCKLLFSSNYKINFRICFPL